MSVHVLDTDIFSLYGRGHPNLDRSIDAHPLEALAIAVITVEEEMAGWYSLLRQARNADEEVRAYYSGAEEDHVGRAFRPDAGPNRVGRAFEPDAGDSDRSGSASGSKARSTSDPAGKFDRFRP